MSREPPVSSPTPEPQDLLSYFHLRQSEAYKDIHFKVKSRGNELQTRSKHNFVNRISFDTINLQYDDDDDDDDNDDLLMGRYEYPDGNRGRGRYRSPSPTYSPLQSPTRRMLSPLGDTMFQVPPRRDYPTSPIITHRGCTYTKTHRQWEALYRGQLEVKPVLARRLILVYISGRKHTWVALDWILSKFLEHGDSVVIVASIPPEFPVRRKSAYRSPTPPRHARTFQTRLRQRHSPEYMQSIARKVMLYAMQVINPEKISKVSVELALGGTKEVLKDMYKLYEPSLVATGAKISIKSSAPLRSWNSSRLSDRLVKNFPLPVIVTPTINMSTFETTLQNTINGGEEPVSTSIIGPDDSDSASIASESSSSSSDSSLSYSSYDEISKLFEDYRQDIARDKKQLKTEELDDNFFANFVKMLSDRSQDFCNDVRGVNPHFAGRGAKLAKAITGSNAFEASPYKTKSLLESVESTNTSKSSQSLSYKEMMQNLKAKTTAPAINVEEPEDAKEHARAPTPSALKFAEQEPPSKTAKAQSKLLQKSLSHDISDLNVRPKLEPLKSHPDLHALSSSTSNQDKAGKTKKSKKGKLWRLFK